MGLWHETREGLNVDLDRNVTAALIDAKIHGGFMAVIYWMKTPTQMMIHRTTNEFPVARYPECVAELKRRLAEEVGETLFQEQDGALPAPASAENEAKAPLLNLFGDQKPKE
jgi:hypothetical protein